MADIHSPEVRSYNMSMIKGKNTKPEMIVRKYLFSLGFRYRLHEKKLPGKPDLVLTKYKTVVFIHGCFWHGHDNCKYFVVPKTRTEWWMNKINTNKSNDLRAVRELKKLKWKVISVWECDLKRGRAEKTLKMIAKQIKK